MRRIEREGEQSLLQKWRNRGELGSLIVIEKNKVRRRAKLAAETEEQRKARISKRKKSNVHTLPHALATTNV